MTDGEQTSKPATLAIKLLRHAMDPACPATESVNAITRLIDVCRRDAITFESLTAAMGVRRKRRQRESTPAPTAHDLVLGFGKYKGWPLGQVVRIDLDYVTWIASEFKNRRIRQAARTVLDQVTTSGAA